MGELIAGAWRRSGLESVLADGELRRPPSVFRNWITTEGDGPFKAEPGRYHLYVSLACPWAHRTLIMRNIKGLTELVGLSVVHWLMGDDGWTFSPGPGVIPDVVKGAKFLHELYTIADPICTSRATVPVLWDKYTGRIVSNESSEILRMFNTAFDGCGAAVADYYPIEHRVEIDAVNARVYATLNNGVYRAGFATTQAAYEVAAGEVFETLDWLEQRLARQRYLVGGDLTEADIRLFTTLVRFDPVYHGHFKCNRRALIDYPALWAYTRDLYQHPAIRPTVDLRHVKGHYYGSHPWLNPSGIVPIGPVRDFDLHSGRENLEERR
ncbi:glutathione S-transferase family protein [Tardiphaga robiniae]|uniref:glutathione S-transferase family protein n=1 Tax=Tardiphaga robiniae TaxID=943830 RepID=UPI001586E066|nr:glutathione S-transferase family protein [Tardiphaga robiniae]NUU42562.1 glutathione S-transferase family protein [Tardiphaga robiniae]